MTQEVNSREQLLETIVALSHEFGGVDYVKGGGGNTSVKNDETLWVKPSGTTLGGLGAANFVAMDRPEIDALYRAETPSEPAARETLVSDLMAAAVTNDAGRPSVEAPLHNLFAATYVVHTHPVLVNGMTCAKDGAEACARLLPDALWVEYIDPGYTLCMVVKTEMDAYVKEHGQQPDLLVLKNHGIFVAGNTPEQIRELYARVMASLKYEYAKAGVSSELAIKDVEPEAATEATIRECFGSDAAFVASSGSFDYAPGPITPDHLVYARAFPFNAALTTEAVTAYRTLRGYAPKVVVAGDRIYGIGTTKKNAELALELAQDGAQVLKLVEAFGGVDYMTDPSREFIENWEVESYRQQVASDS
jgi:rhamnose utilization protein RhaD (predicted bifunctional aldolase and dehydrogenase)